MSLAAHTSSRHSHYKSVPGVTDAGQTRVHSSRGPYGQYTEGTSFCVGCWTDAAAAGVPTGSHCSPCLPWQVYESGSNVDQFVTRFLLKETANQTQSLLSSVESAVDAIDEQTNPGRSAASPALLRHCFLVDFGTAGWRESWGSFCRVRENAIEGVQEQRGAGQAVAFLFASLPGSLRDLGVFLQCSVLPCP